MVVTVPAGSGVAAVAVAGFLGLGVLPEASAFFELSGPFVVGVATGFSG